MKLLPNLASKYDFPFLFNLLRFDGHGAEVGVQRGVHANHLRQNWQGGTLHLVDFWQHQNDYYDTANVSQNEQDSNFAHVQALFGGRSDVRIVRGASVKVAATYPDGFFDWVYLDANHAYNAVRDDLTAWAPKVRRGGILAGHDFMDGVFFNADFGVRRAVLEWAKQKGHAVRVASDDCCPSWFVQC